MTYRKYVKSSRSGGSGGNCVEWALDGSVVYVRDSKDPTGPELPMTHAEWMDFTAAAAAQRNHPWIRISSSGATVTTANGSLRFTTAEWLAFAAGARAGECTLSVSTVVA